MISQTKCKGYSCPMRQFCHRFERGPIKVYSKSFSEYFLIPPFKIIDDNFLCDSYIGDPKKLPIVNLLEKV